MIKRLYSLDDSFELCWVDIDTDYIIDNKSIKYNVIEDSTMNDPSIYKFCDEWIYSKEKKSGVWHKTVESLKEQLKLITNNL